MIKHAGWLSMLWALAVHAASPFGPVAHAPTPIRLTSGPPLTLVDGDFAYPRFSPNGHRLAFARSVVRDRKELTEIGLLDPLTGKQSTLLDANGSRKYAAYTSFVYRLSWTDNRRLVAAISDGDVGASAVTFDTDRGAVAGEQDLSAGGPGTEAATTDRMAHAFPGIARDVLDSAMRNAIVLDNGSAIIQKDYAGQDEHIWWLNPITKQATRLVSLPDDWIHALAGGFAFGDRLIFLLQHGGEAYLLAYRAGSVTPLLQTRADGQQARLEVNYADRDRVFFMIYTNAPYRRSDNLLLMLDGKGLHRAKDAAPLADADIAPASGRVALTVWQGDKRILQIYPLRSPLP